MTYRKFNATAPSSGRHQHYAALAGCLAVAHRAPVFAQGEPDAAPARIGVGLLRALGIGQPDDAATADGNSQRAASAGPEFGADFRALMAAHLSTKAGEA